MTIWGLDGHSPTGYGLSRPLVNSRLQLANLIFQIRKLQIPLSQTNEPMPMNYLKIVRMMVLFVLSGAFGQEHPTDEETVRQQIERTGAAVRQAFKQGDLETIKLYHHPEVTKALSYTNLQRNREEVLDGLRETMANFELEFLDGKATEKFIHHGDLVIKQMRFALRLIPKNGDEPFVFKGRTLLVLQRYDESPTGWVTLHEIVQPFQE